MNKFSAYMGWFLGKAILVYVIFNSYISIRDSRSLIPEIAALFAFFAWKNTLKIMYGNAIIYDGIRKPEQETKFYRLRGE